MTGYRPLPGNGPSEEERDNSDTASSNEDNEACNHEFCFLTAVLEDKRWWWPVAVYFPRAVLLAISTAVIPFTSAFMPLLVFVVLLLALLTHVVGKPYNQGRYNALEAFVLAATLTRFVLGMVRANYHSGTGAALALDVFGDTLIVLVNLFVFFVAFRKRVARWRK